MIPRSVKKPTTHSFTGRDSLGAYITHPERCDSSIVISYNDDFVIIKDKFPKSSVHFLLLPRNAKYTHLHPIEAFADASFLSLVRQEVRKVQELVVNELRLRYDCMWSKNQDTKHPHQQHQQQQQQRTTITALDQCSSIREESLDSSSPLPSSLPLLRDWDKDIISGIHARPSMSHLHVHVLSVDRYSDCLKHRKHYNSFATRFFIPIKDFPLEKEDARRYPEREGYLKSDLKCWRCGENFGNKFSCLKKHLAMEFEEWKKD